MSQRCGAIWTSPHGVTYGELLSYGFPLGLLWRAPCNRKPNAGHEPLPEAGAKRKL